MGPTTERSLWRQGCTDWECLLGAFDQYSLGTATEIDARRTLENSLKADEEGNHQYFRKALGLAEAWRAYERFQDSVLYLDIETDGGFQGESVTTIGMYDGKEFRALVKGNDLAEFPDLVSHYSLIVTFFGAGFDLPMLQKKFWGLQFDQIHIDLCPTLKRLGYRGGLKKIEKQLGIQRGEECDGLNGLDAINLWKSYCQGDEKALETLIAYNREDVVNLETLAKIAFDRMKQMTYGAATKEASPTA